ncbi:MAG: hypothetical protein M0Q02_11045 [Candidatus Muirbacterium halophilum]|nr:hypothetical protein [Candidatus Muirbacterium halophilum]
MTNNFLLKEEHELIEKIENLIKAIDNLHNDELFNKLKNNCLHINDYVNELLSKKDISIISDIKQELDRILNSFKIYYMNNSVDSDKYEEILTIIDEIYKELK